MDNLSKLLQIKKDKLLHIEANNNCLINAVGKKVVKLHLNDDFSYKNIVEILKDNIGKIASTILKNSAISLNDIVFNKNATMIDWSIDDNQDIDALHRLRLLSQEVFKGTFINPLFLGLGSIDWKLGDEKFSSPLIIIPINLVLNGGKNQPLAIEFEDKEAYVNPAGLLKIKLELGIELPTSFDDIIEYFDNIEKILSEYDKQIIKINKNTAVISLTYIEDLCMYYDIKNNFDSIKESPLINMVFNKGYQSNILENEFDIDSFNYESGVFVHDQNKSQYELIKHALAGESFVIEGPPGTGKSLTISNLITSAIAHDKSVLFVSTKKAALDEVYNKTPDNIKPYLLKYDVEGEVYNASTKKVFDSLVEAYKAMNINEDVKLYEDKKNLGKFLNESMNRTLNRMSILHKKNRLGISNYDLLSLAIENKNPSQPKIKIDNINEYSSFEYEKDKKNANVISSKLHNAFNEFKHPFHHPFYGVKDTMFNNQDLLKKLSDFYNKLSRDFTKYCNINNYSIDDIRFLNNLNRNKLVDDILLGNDYSNAVPLLEEYLKIKESLLNMLTSKDIPGCKLPIIDNAYNLDLSNMDSIINSMNDVLNATTENNLSVLMAKISICKDSRIKLVESMRKICIDFDSKILDIEFDTSEKTINKLASKLGLFSGKYKKIVEEIKQYYVGISYTQNKAYEFLKYKKEYDTYLNIVNRLEFEGVLLKYLNEQMIDIIYNSLGVSSTKESLEEINSNLLKIKQYTDIFKFNEKINIVEFSNLYNRYLLLADNLRDLLKDDIDLNDETLSILLNSDLIRNVDSLDKEALSNYKDQEVTDLINVLDEYYDYYNVICISDYKSNLRIYDIIHSLSLANCDSLSDYIAYYEKINSISDKTIKTYLSNFISCYNEEYSYQKFNEYYFYELYSSLINLSLKVDDFKNKSSMRLNEEIDEFIENLNQLYSVNSRIIADNLALQARRAASTYPMSFSFLEGSSRYKSVKALFNDKAIVIKSLKKCIMATPSAVSQLLSSKEYSDFDLIVFDEASQINDYRAISVLYRGKQLIAVGDPYQMPSTEFFRSNEYEQYYSQETDDKLASRSILDTIMDNENLEIRMLKTHYRSKYESLIAFSNKYFYKEQLISFPSSMLDDNNLGLVDCYIEDGYCQNGINKLEANKLMEILKTHIEQYYENGRLIKTLGIIVFGVSYEKYLRTMINKSELASIFKELEDRLDIFISTIENVQGHEMDYIALSLTYGRNESLNVVQQFGMLNHTNDRSGEYRFNVAITRAKEVLYVVHSVKFSDITSPNLKVVKEFLYLVENKKTIINNQQSEAKTRIKALENAIYRILAREFGEDRILIDYGLLKNSYKIPLALLDEDKKNIIAALIFDSYNDKFSIKDAYYSYPQMLKQRGLKVIRIYAYSWYNDFENEKQRMMSSLINREV